MITHLSDAQTQTSTQPTRHRRAFKLQRFLFGSVSRCHPPATWCRRTHNMGVSAVAGPVPSQIFASLHAPATCEHIYFHKLLRSKLQSVSQYQKVGTHFWAIAHSLKLDHWNNVHATSSSSGLWRLRARSVTGVVSKSQV